MKVGSISQCPLSLVTSNQLPNNIQKQSDTLKQFKGQWINIATYGKNVLKDNPWGPDLWIYVVGSPKYWLTIMRENKEATKTVED